MTEEELEARVRAILADIFGLAPDDVGPDTSTDTVERWDSLQHLTVVLSLEEEFEVQFEDEETLTLVSFPLITAAVREKLGMAELS